MFGFGSFNYLESQEQKDKEKRQGQKKKISSYFHRAYILVQTKQINK